MVLLKKVWKDLLMSIVIYKSKKVLIFSIFSFYEQLKFHALAWKWYNLGAMSDFGFSIFPKDMFFQIIHTKSYWIIFT